MARVSPPIDTSPHPLPASSESHAGTSGQDAVNDEHDEGVDASWRCELRPLGWADDPSQPAEGVDGRRRWLKISWSLGSGDRDDDDQASAALPATVSSTAVGATSATARTSVEPVTGVAPARTARAPTAVATVATHRCDVEGP